MDLFCTGRSLGLDRGAAVDVRKLLQTTESASDLKLCLADEESIWCDKISTATKRLLAYTLPMFVFLII